MTRMEMCNNIGIIGYGDICELVGLSLRGGRDWILVANDLLFWSRTYNTSRWPGKLIRARCGYIFGSSISHSI